MKKPQRFDFQSPISVIFMEYYSIYIYFFPHVLFVSSIRVSNFWTRLDKNLPPTFKRQWRKKSQSKQNKISLFSRIACSSPVSCKTLSGKETVSIISASERFSEVVDDHPKAKKTGNKTKVKWGRKRKTGVASETEIRRAFSWFSRDFLVEGAPLIFLAETLSPTVSLFFHQEETISWSKLFYRLPISR